MYVTRLRSRVDHDVLQKKSPVLLIGNFLSESSGGRGFCEDLAAQLKNSGWAVITASGKNGRFLRLLDMITTVWKNRHRYSVTNIEVYSGPAFFWAEIVCQILHAINKPYVLTLHGGNLPSFAQRWPRSMRHLLRSAAVATTPSHYLLEQMRAYRADLRVLPNALDLIRYTFRLRAHPRPDLVWMRAFHEIYNPLLAPQVVSLLAADFQDIHLTMIGQNKGDGSLERAQQLAANPAVNRHTVLRGAVPKADVPYWLNTGDIFLNTTNVDNTPVSVLEAMACGLCVVSTDVGGIPYLLQDERDALLVPPDDPEAMAQAVRRILTEPGLARHLSQNARQKAEQFDWAKVLPQWEQLLICAVRESSD